MSDRLILNMGQHWFVNMSKYIEMKGPCHFYSKSIHFYNKSRNTLVFRCYHGSTVFWKCTIQIVWYCLKYIGVGYKYNNHCHGMYRSTVILQEFWIFVCFWWDVPWWFNSILMFLFKSTKKNHGILLYAVWTCNRVILQYMTINEWQ